MKVLKYAVLLLALFQAAMADTYLHNPRGCNNRLDEQNQNRNNANRLFDSQNNNNGGYNVGNLYYYAGSNFMFEWTSQHGSNDPKVHNQQIFQIMCEEQSPGLRDGTTRGTISEDPEESNNIKYGQHENYVYYQNCKKRERNYGLYTADQLSSTNKNNKRSAIYTRQDNNGERFGFECPEERDYYPYWHPTPWIDIAVLTSNMTLCEFYWRESQNVVGKSFCTVPDYNNMKECTDAGGSWNTTTPIEGLQSPICMPVPWSRDNHLGNTVGGYMASFNTTIPNLISERCVFRTRYNVSTEDFDTWNTFANKNADQEDPLILADYPSGTGPVPAKGNPEIDIGIDVDLQLNIDTSQFGRTFQDRSFTFAIRPAPSGVDPKKIHNLNIRGRRGNIVEVYPAVEYDFTPQVLVVRKGDYIHLQWTGSNTTPNGAGEGAANTDRSNFVEIANAGMNYPIHLDNITWTDDKQLARKVALLDPGQFGGESSTLDDAGTYFDAGLIKFDKKGTFHYASTRNNNFSNRSQKGTIIVTEKEGLSTGSIVGIAIGSTVGAVLLGGVVVGAIVMVAVSPIRQKIFKV